jgi:hypothetical protein
MDYRENVTARIRLPDIEHNFRHVYFRFDFRKSVVPATETEPEHTIWTWNEYYMPENEYYMICCGAYGEEYNDVFRSVQREYLYTYADKMIMKYTTDAPDETLRQAWVDYKHSVRQTQYGPTYPEQVEYPDYPE